VADQFLRYDLDIDGTILNLGHTNGQVRRHTIQIEFLPSIPVNGRFTACSGGWDWAPYVRAHDAEGTQMYTLGLTFKPVNVIGVWRFYISYVVPKIYYLGEHPTKPMQRPDADF
jgi:hypothetical protein